jgi:hypothetical protein
MFIIIFVIFCDDPVTTMIASGRVKIIIVLELLIKSQPTLRTATDTLEDSPLRNYLFIIIIYNNYVVKRGALL